MKWLNIKFISVFIVAFIISSALFSQTKYEKRIEGYESFWHKLTPRYTKLHFAGSMGLLSFGTGWNYAKHWETDVYLGFVPKYTTSKNKVTFTVKQNYMPWKLRKDNSRFSFEPLACGLYVNTIFGGDFWASEPERYPSGYYNFSTKVRFNIYAGQRITYDIQTSKRFFAKSITFFYEIHSSDLYIVSAFTNSYLKPKDYLGLSFGVKMQIL